MHDSTLHKTMLFDFYGELLTEKQREYFDLYHNEDLSLAEIASGAGISRQGVYDIINRAEKTLINLEQKTGIVDKWHKTRNDLDEIKNISQKISEYVRNNDESTELTELSAQLLETIKKLEL